MKKKYPKKECRMCHYLTGNKKHEAYKCCVPGDCPCYSQEKKEGVKK